MDRKHINILPLKVAFILIGGIILAFSFLFYPYIYDFFVGDKIIERNIDKIVGNATGHHETALAIMRWHSENVIYPWPEDNLTLISGSNGFYKINNKTKLFLRSKSASWVIKTKLARCGESASYFVELMDYLGYESREIHPVPLEWDHAWAEYYDEEGNMIVVDPSANKVVPNRASIVEGKNLTKIIAKYPNGTEVDVSEEYLGGLQNGK